MEMDEIQARIAETEKAIALNRLKMAENDAAIHELELRQATEIWQGAQDALLPRLLVRRQRSVRRKADASQRRTKPLQRCTKH